MDSSFFDMNKFSTDKIGLRKNFSQADLNYTANKIYYSSTLLSTFKSFDPIDRHLIEE
jgi:hypothetical protein